jgi:hypothetical protein
MSKASFALNIVLIAFAIIVVPLLLMRTLSSFIAVAMMFVRFSPSLVDCYSCRYSCNWRLCISGQNEINPEKTPRYRRLIHGLSSLRTI